MTGRALLAAACATIALAAAGCESTRDRASKVAAGGTEAFDEEAVRVRRNPDVRILAATVLSDPNGTAVVVEMRNEGARTQAQVPLDLRVRDGKGKVLYRNDDPGLQGSLLRVPVLPAGHKVTWIHDQVNVVGGTEAVAFAGTAKPVPGELPRIEVTRVRLEGDPVSGMAAAGRVRNASEVLQTDLVVFGVARRGDELVAAGRAILPRLAPGRSAPFRIFFIGNPRGARIGVSAPPTVLS